MDRKQLAEKMLLELKESPWNREEGSRFTSFATNLSVLYEEGKGWGFGVPGVIPYYVPDLETAKEYMLKYFFAPEESGQEDSK